MFRRRMITLGTAMAMAVLLVSPASAQLGLGKKDKDKEEAKADAKAEKQKKTEASTLAKYEKLKEYSLNKYQTDPDFRDEVDEAFENLLRDHSERAFQKNTQRNSYIQVVHEDSWRVHQNLYDNLLVQAHINRIGQSLVPAESEQSFAFKVVPDPTPLAETLATGTVYVSTGLISLLDSEAQLAYVLAHEMAHVHLQHWKERAMMQEGSEAYAAERAKKLGRIALLGTIAGGMLGAGVGAAAGNTGRGAEIGLLGGAVGGMVAGMLLNRPLLVNWDRVAEDKADELAFKSVLNAHYDVREIPNLYVAMEKATLKDARVGLGFLGDRRRIKQRKEKTSDLIANAYKAEIAAQLSKGFLANSNEHRNLMAELKRDNGIMAYYRDMFELARTNLADATAIRDNDAAAHYFFGKVLEQVGRTPDDLRLARDSFFKATQNDPRKQQFGAHLHLALLMAREKGMDRQQVANEIDSYVTNYARWNVENATMRAFPPNLDSIYEYMVLYGDAGWRPNVPDLKDMPNFQNYQTLMNLVAGSDLHAPVPATQATRNTAAPQVGTAEQVGKTVVDTIAPGAGKASNMVKQVGDQIQQRQAAPPPVKKK